MESKDIISLTFSNSSSLGLCSNKSFSVKFIQASIRKKMRLLAPFIFAVLESTWALPSGSDLPHNVLEYLVDEGYINIFHDWCNEENSKICEHLIISEESYKVRLIRLLRLHGF